MGYTHYWKLNNKGDQRAYAAALVDMAEIVRHSPVPLGDNHGEPTGPELTDQWLGFNGRGDLGCSGDGCHYCGGPNSGYFRDHDQAHETALFYTRLEDSEQWRSESPDDPWVFSFCKTAQKPYDVVVTAVLCRLAECGPDLVQVTSDGEPDDWMAGSELATRVLNRVVDIPRTVKEYRVEA